MKVCPVCATRYPNDAGFCQSDGTRLVDEPGIPRDSLLNTIVDDRYRLMSKIGDGGMSVVYLGRHEDLRKSVAVKVLKQELLAEGHGVERFRREAMASCAIGNPHIVEVMDYGQLPDGRFYYVMELLKGESLERRIGREAPLGVEDVREIALQICDGLHAAHEQEIVHRDVKPENIFLCSFKGQLLVKILDFGIARAHEVDDAGPLTQTGIVFGTPHYISPEQTQSMRVDRRSDIYSLGVILFQMVTGQLPFDDDSVVRLMLKHVQQPPQPPMKVAPHSPAAVAFNNVILRTLAKKPQERFSTMEELAASLASVETSYPTLSALPTTPFHRDSSEISFHDTMPQMEPVRVWEKQPLEDVHDPPLAEHDTERKIDSFLPGRREPVQPWRPEMLPSSEPRRPEGGTLITSARGSRPWLLPFLVSLVLVVVLAVVLAVLLSREEGPSGQHQLVVTMADAAGRDRDGGGAADGGYDAGRTDLGDDKEASKGTRKAEGKAAPVEARRLTKEEIAEVVRRGRNGIGRCGAQKGPSGTVKMKVIIENSGKVKQAVATTSAFKGSALGACCEREIQGWRFPPFEGKALTIHIPFSFQSQQAPSSAQAMAEKPALTESLTQGAILKVVRGGQNGIYQCKAQGGPSGTMMVRVTIEISGRVDQVVVITPEFKGTALGACCSRAISAWRFPPFGGKAVTVNLPFVL